MPTVRAAIPARRRDRAWVWRVAVVLSGVLFVSTLIVATSSASFTSSTDNAANAFASGSVVLTDDDGGSSLFTLPAMYPGQTFSNCLVVTYSGTLDPVVVRLYSGGFADSGNVADHLVVTVDEGAGGAHNDCTGFVEDDAGAEFSDTLTQFGALHTNYATGVGEWDPTGPGQSKTYRVTVELDAAAPAAVQGESVTALTFVWETQS